MGRRRIYRYIWIIVTIIKFKTDEGGNYFAIDAVSSQLYEDNALSWYGTDMGLSRLLDSGWTEYSLGTHMLNNDQVSSLGSYSNEILIGTRGGGVNRLVVEGLDAVSGASAYDSIWTGLPSGHINCILVDASDGKWFGTPLGLSLHEGDATKEGWTSYAIDNGLISNNITVFSGSNITALLMNSDFDLWVGTDEGLSIYRDGNMLYKNDLEVFNGLRITDIFQIKGSGGISITTDHGIFIVTKK
jgi:ligand-binding sensor domain-containing protein